MLVDMLHTANLALHCQRSSAFTLAAAASAVVDAVNSRRRKQTKPRAKPAASNQSEGLPSDSASEEFNGQARHSAFTELLEDLANVHSTAAAAIAAGKSAAAAGGEGASAAPAGGFHGAEMQQAFAEMQQLVQEDVERMSQQWEQQEMPKLQRGACDIWKE